MADFREQRACIKFCFKLGKTATECYEMLKTAIGEPKLNPVNGKVRGHLDRRRQGKARQVRSNIKSMLICLFDQKGIVHKEFAPPGQTVNAAFYVEVLKRLQENVRRKRPDQWRNNTWLHNDNAPAHAAILTRRFLTDNNMTVVPHPPYWPDLAPSDFFLFPKPKMNLKARRFQTLEEIQAESQAVLNTLREK